MKQIFLLLVCSLFIIVSNSQTNYKEAMDEGDRLYEKGEFGKAIDIYLAAQAFNPLKKDTVKINIKKGG